MDHEGPWAALQVLALTVGLLVNLPLLSQGLLPRWCGPGLRTLLAFVDARLDAAATDDPGAGAPWWQSDPQLARRDDPPAGRDH